jgi:hypothetical protein
VPQRLAMEEGLSCSQHRAFADMYLSHNRISHRLVTMDQSDLPYRESMPTLAFLRPHEPTSVHRITQAQSDAERCNISTLAHQDVCDLLNRVLKAVGRIAASHEGEVIDAIANVRSLLLACRTCLEYEDHVIRPVLDARDRRVTAVTEIDYLRDRVACDAADADLTDIEYGSPEVRRAAAVSLHRRLASFVIRVFSRMQVAQREIGTLPEAEHAGDQRSTIGDASARPRVLATLLCELGRHLVARSPIQTSNREHRHGSAQRT